MNFRGVYTPQQVIDNTDYYWNKHNSSGETFVNYETTYKIVKDTVNYLGSLGNGQRFSIIEFDKIY